MKKELVNHLIYGFMRIGLLPLLLITSLAGMIYASPSRGQEVLNKKIDLVAQQQEVKVVLTQISRIAGVKFVYSAQKIPSRKKVTVLAYNQRLAEVLDRLLEPLEIFYHVSGNQVVLMHKGDDDNALFALSAETDKTTPDNAVVERPVTGKVTNENGDPLNGVSVLVKGTARGTSTNGEGTFSINVNAGETLEFSMVGYKLFAVKIADQKSVTVQLQPLNASLNEIVVVGYGSQKRSTLTGAVASVNSKTLNELPVASIDQALQGRVSGLNVTNNGSPGTPAIVAIRGISSINYASDPLYVIDGFPTGNLSNFDAKDVESVEVLKDASAAAIYGSRATNGVILITTKKGKRTGRAQVSLDSYVGIQSPAKKISLLNTNQYLQYERALNGAAGIGIPPRLQPANFNQPIYAGSKQTFAQTNTDWQDAYFRRNAVITQHNISIIGGNAVSRYYTSAGYFKQDGIAQGLSYERGNFRINSDHNISKAVTFGENLYVSVGNQHYEGTGGNRSPLTNVIRMQPYIPVRNPNNPGGFMGPQNSFDGADPTNPVEPAILNHYTIKTLKVLGTAYVDINFTSWLKFRSTFGVDYSNAYNQQYIPIFNDGGTLSATSASINNQRQLFTTLLYTQQLTFDKSFDRHHLNATAVFERQGQNYTNETASGNQSTNDVTTLNGATNVASNSRFESNLIISYVGRITYDYAGKYLFSASLRRDGLSVWAPGHKFENFPSASVGWKIDQESFMAGVKNISELKLRAGYGLTGLNAALGPVGGNGTALGNYPWEVGVQANQALYPFGGGLGNGPASYYNQLGNKSLVWETTKQLNFGLDLGLFENRLTITAEYFRRKMDGTLILNVPTPPSFGLGGAGVNANVAGMTNNGFELQTGYHKNYGDFKWDLAGLVSVIRNKVTNLNTANASITAGGDADFGGGADITKTVAGQAVQSFYGWQTDGIFQSAADLAKGPVQLPGTDPMKSTAPGDIRFKDRNGDGKITDSDRTFLGSYLPKFTYSLNYTASYKNFDAGIFLQGVQGNKVFNAERIIAEGMVRLFNSGTAVLNAWTSSHTNTSMPRAISGDPNQNVRPSDRWIESGSYLRIKNLMIGYSIPGGALQSLTKGAISRFRIYVSSQNLVTITKYKGWDPEIGTRRSALTNGIDYGQYPTARSYQVGVQVGF